LMGGLLHLVQRGGAWAGGGPVQSPLRCTKRSPMMIVSSYRFSTKVINDLTKYINQRSYSTQKGRECLREVSKPTFDLARPWPLTLWRTKLIVSRKNKGTGQEHSASAFQSGLPDRGINLPDNWGRRHCSRKPTLP